MDKKKNILGKCGVLSHEEKLDEMPGAAEGRRNFPTDFSELGASVLEFGTMKLGCLGGHTPRSWPETPSIVSPGAGAVSLLCYCSPSLTTSAVTNRNGVVGRWSSAPHGKM